MEFLIKIAVAILPVYLIALYVYKKDKEKESSKLLTKLFIFGMLSCIPAAIIEITVEPMFGKTENMNLALLFIYVSIGIALVEELCKWFIVYKVTYYNEEFDHIYDAIVYCVFVSLGFACLENILYVVTADSMFTGILRAITAIPGHASDAIIMGNYLGFSKIAEINNNDELNKRNLLLSILMPTLLHAIYDYCLFTGNIFFVILFVIFLIFIYIFSIKKIKKLSSVGENFIKRNNIIINTNNSIIKTNEIHNQIFNYCPNCGEKVTGKFCARCGKELGQK